MKNIFMDCTHKQRYLELLARDGLLEKRDREREAIFLIIAGNPELFRSISNIYNFRTRSLSYNIWNYMDEICTSGRNLLKLGINLYNGYAMGNTDPCELLQFLDSYNLRLALNAMYLRFS